MASKDLSTDQAAALMAIHSRSVLRWIKAGRIPAYQTGGGRWRIRTPDLACFMLEQGMQVPATLLDGAQRVAVVDDDRDFAEALTETLLELVPSLDVRSAHDGLSAGFLLAGFRPQLVLLDRTMPGLDGFEVLRRLRSQPELNGAAVIVISGELDVGARQRFMELGAARCLAKPVDDHELWLALVDFVPGVSGASRRLPVAGAGAGQADSREAG